MWFFWSLGNAFTDSLKDVFGAKGSRKFDEYLVCFAQRFFALPVLLPLAFIFELKVEPDVLFWKATAMSIIINIPASILYYRALKESSLSLALPVVTLSPVFLLVTSPLINREVPSMLGVLGVMISVLGTYLLSLSERREGGFFAPLTVLWENPGMRLMLIVAFLWSFGAPFDRIAVTHADPFFYNAVKETTLAAVFFFVVIVRGGLRNLFHAKAAKILAPMGLLSGISITFQMIAFSLTLVPYAISVKRASALFGILWGKLYFGETNLKERFVGAIVILAGAVMILLSTL